MILFIPHYYYLHYEIFNEIQSSLLEMGQKPCLLHIPKASGIDETATFNENRFQIDGFKYITIKIRKTTSTRAPSIIKKINNFINLKNNLGKITDIITTKRPYAVVIGSHFGGIYIRHIQVICHKLKIPVYSIWTNYEHNGHFNLDLMNRSYDFFLRYTFMKDIYKWDVINTFTKNNKFIVSGKKTYSQLKSFGFHDEQLREVAMGINYITNKAPTRKNNILIVTEVIHEVLGVDYISSYAKDLALCCKNLKLKTIIKFHPRETERTKALYLKELYFAEVSQDEDLNILFARTKLAIGMYSKFLETLMANRIPTISYNPTSTPSYSIYSSTSPLLFQDKGKLEKFLLEIDNKLEQTNLLCEQWLKENNLDIPNNWQYLAASYIAENTALFYKN